MTKLGSKGLDGSSSLLNQASTRPMQLTIREVLQIANTIGIDVDLSTLRFWQKRGLLPNPTPGLAANGRGTRGYYDQAILDRLSFIREVQTDYGMPLGAIREELERIDKKILQSGNASPASLFAERLKELKAERDQGIHSFLFAMVSRALGISPEEISAIVVRKKNGETIRLTDGQPQTGADRHG